MKSSLKTLILGASTNPQRFSYLALKDLLTYGHPVIAVGKSGGQVEDVLISREPIWTPGVDTVTLYLNPTHQKAFYDYIISLKPRRIIFNPGAENHELASLAKANDIQPINACTLVMLRTGQY